MAWNEIETAPKDGRPLLLFVPYADAAPDWVAARWQDFGNGLGQWRLVQCGDGAEEDGVSGAPTHWADLPRGPAGEVWELPEPLPPPAYGPPVYLASAMMAKAALSIFRTAREPSLMQIKPPQAISVRLPTDYIPPDKGAL